MRQKGVPGTVQATLLAGLPETFAEWITRSTVTKGSIDGD
jgi:hypothetical protein